MSKWLPLEITEKQAMAMVRAVDHFIDCHNEYSDCSPRNHPKWELDAIGLVGFKIGDAMNRVKHRNGEFDD